MATNIVALLPHFDEVELTDTGELSAHVQVVQAEDGFSSFMRGRLAEDVPLYVQRIDTHCAVSQHLAAVSALDLCYSVTPAQKAIALRRALAYAGVYYHHLEQLFLSRASGGSGISGFITSDDNLAASDIFDTLKEARDVIDILGGRGLTPERGIPGGMTKGLTDEELQVAKDISSDLTEFATRAAEGFNASGATWVRKHDLSVPAYSLATVNDAGEASLYDGKLRIVDPKGNETAAGSAEEILPIVLGWKEDLPLRLGPLARLNACSGSSTPQAKAFQKHMFEVIGQPPIDRVAAGNWAMVIELVEASELLVETLSGLESGEAELRSSLNEPGEGIAAIEGASGTLLHRYVIDEQGIVQEAQVVSEKSLLATEVNAALSLIISDGASGVTEGVIERIVGVIGSYQPAYVPSATFPLRITLLDDAGEISKEWRRP